ncbi:MAG: hypothetical protein VB118_11785 [Oscillospiraceae bacterium]|nr:hypothetical protein [Oscillospiraceae bacterium]
MLKSDIGFILKTLLFQIVLSIFGNMMALGTLSYDPLMFAGGIIMAGLYIYLVYSMYWKKGAERCINKEAGLLGAFNGLLLILIASVPTIIMATVACSGPLVYTDGNPTSKFAVFQIMCLALTGQYRGIIQVIYPNILIEGISSTPNAIQPLAYLFSVIPAIVAGGTGYYLGFRDISILKLLGINIKPANNGDR